MHELRTFGRCKNDATAKTSPDAPQLAVAFANRQEIGRDEH
jgi:hypothetical protein